MTRPPRSPGSTLVLRLNYETVHDFILFFLPPCSPHLTPLAIGSHEPSLLVFSTPEGLLLQYSAKSQSAPRCQSLITARSDHPPVLGRSGPHTVELSRL
jgi:hypothetical protein